MNNLKFKEANLFESNSHLRELPPCHETVNTKTLRSRTGVGMS